MPFPGYPPAVLPDADISLQLAALKDHFQQACAAFALPRPATVLDRMIIGFWNGTMPLVEVLFVDRNVKLIGGSQMTDMGQDFNKANHFTIRIRSATDDAVGINADDAQTECFLVVEAIEKWFSVIPHRVLPTSLGVERVKFAGPPFYWKGALGPYALPDETLGQVLGGTITVLGIPRAVSMT